MRWVVITRTEMSDEGTFGHLATDTGVFLRSGELPWRRNEPGMSCIPRGIYEAVWAESPTKGWCYHLIRVPGRMDIEIHSANFVGDRVLGLKCELMGCIALGQAVGTLDGQRALLMSREAMTEFHRELAKAPFQLSIEKGY
jgi:hypothetical protein